MKQWALILLSLYLFFVITTGSAHAQHFTVMAITGDPPYRVLIQSGQLSEIIALEETVDEVGLFTLAEDGITEICIGMSAVTDDFSMGTGPLGIVAYRWDRNPYTNPSGVKNGFEDGDPIIIRIWDNSMNMEYVAIVDFLQGGTYGDGAETVISTFTTTAPIPTVGEWGMIFLGLTILVVGNYELRIRN